MIRVACRFIYNVKKLFFASGECFAIDKNLLMGDYNRTDLRKVFTCKYMLRYLQAISYSNYLYIVHIIPNNVEEISVLIK